MSPFIDIVQNKSGAQILISFGENFPSAKSNQGNRGGMPAGIQLVRQMVPRGLQTLPSNTTLKTKLYLEIPDYIEEWSRTRISILVQKQTRDISIQQNVETFSRSFYFTISARNISSIDSDPPVCRWSMMCNDRISSCDNLGAVGSETQMPTCENKYWHSMISVADDISGVHGIEVTSPGSRSISKSKNVNLKYPEDIGTVDNVDVWLKTSCCYDGVEITVHDVAGHKTKCVSGINPNAANVIYVYISDFCILMGNGMLVHALIMHL